MGIALERRLALGTVVVRMITSAAPGVLAERLRTLLFTTCPRWALTRVVRAAAELDPQLFFTVDHFSQATSLGPLPSPTAWRAVLKKK